ncbi:sporulation protein [Jeotgalibacillus marinus]|uniref:Sporulation protein n=1 Tax=Jeotgalibacillus marinus TaxID=86667 RepID=A0ABV3Q6M9_9BACL
MLEKFFSSIGFGGVEVDTNIDRNTFSPGETVKGTMHVKGGNADQEINGIKLTLFVTHNEVREDSDLSYYDEELTQVILKDLTKIKAKEEKKLPFQIQLKNNHPKTGENVESFIQTKLLVINGVDPADKDIIIIK